MSITIFLKNRRKNALQKKLYELMEISASELAMYNSNKKSYDKTDRYIAKYSYCFNPCTLSDELKRLTAYEQAYSVHYQRYFNLQAQIHDLEEQIRKL